MMSENLSVIFPEIFLISMTCIILLIDLVFKSKQKNLIYVLTQLTLLILLGLNIYLFNQPTTLLFNHSFILDPLASVLKILIEISSIFVFWVSKDYIHSRRIPAAEFYLLSLLAILGMLLLVSAHHFIVLFLALELSALPVYALVALWEDSPTGSEAAMKYFVMGALASGILLYGLSMLYGATNSLEMNSITLNPSHNLLLIFSLVFILTGIVFKWGAAPFHLWVPDVYTGAPTAITLFISAAPKIAALGMAYRLLVYNMPILQPQWQEILIIVSVVSMALGNFAAIVQTNLKRMLAYSSIAHMGYLSLGILCGTTEGYAASLFYILSYALMVIGAFGLLTLFSREKEIEEIADLKALNSRNPWLAFMFLIILFSMAGIPPTIGFFAKMTVLQALINIHLVWLAVVAIVLSVIGAYYYIHVVKIMYFESVDNDSSLIPFQYKLSLSAVVTLSGIMVLFFGVFPGVIFYLSRMVF
jgi:NADH-quinone oxidoreductase subunit N